MMPPQPPPGQGPVDPRGAFSQPPPPPTGSSGFPQAPTPPQGGPGMYSPPVMMMPPPFFPPPPPPRGGSFARGIFMILATSIFGLSIAMNVYFLLFSGVLNTAEGVHQNVLVEGDSQQKIAAVPITGLIDELAAQRFDSIMRRLEKDKNIKALVLEIDTPGGSVTASDEIYNRVRKFKETMSVPVVVSMGGLATSGGYYISCAADSIVAQRTTITGNIGVLMPRYNLTKMADKWGIEDTTLHSTGSTFKDAGSMFREERPEERAYWLGIIDDAYSTFKDVVKTGRANKLKAPMEEIANGKAYTAAESIKMGLIDQTGYASDAYVLAASMAKLTKKHVVRYEPLQSLFSMFGADSKFRGPSGAGVNLNGVNFNLDSHILDDLATPRLMYLWRGQ